MSIRSARPICGESGGEKMLTLEHDPHIKSVWGINLQFASRNPNIKWRPGDFILHFAGLKQKLGFRLSEQLLLKYAVLAPRENADWQKHRGEVLLLKLQASTPPAIRTRC